MLLPRHFHRLRCSKPVTRPVHRAARRGPGGAGSEGRQRRLLPGVQRGAELAPSCRPCFPVKPTKGSKKDKPRIFCFICFTCSPAGFKGNRFHYWKHSLILSLGLIEVIICTCSPVGFKGFPFGVPVTPTKKKVPSTKDEPPIWFAQMLCLPVFSLVCWKTKHTGNLSLDIWSRVSWARSAKTPRSRSARVFAIT